MVFGSVPIAHAQSDAPFPDMQDTWYRYNDAVIGLKDRGIINGYPDGTFGPHNTINRAELLKIIFKGNAVSGAERRCFSDVNPDEWYAPFVCTAKRRGIINGYPDGTFKPAQTVNFAEAIKIILRAYGRDIEDASGEQWFAPYVEELDRNDIFPEHSYIPWEDLSRLRASDLIWRVLRYDEDGMIYRFSSGCGKAKPSVATSIDVEGQQRGFLLTVPDDYIIHDPVPLVIAFHGRTNDNDQVKSYYRLDRELDTALIAYPAAKSNGNGSFSWSDPGDTPYELRDIAFFDALVRNLASKYCVDMNRIFVVGHSLGGWFSNSLACVRGDVIRGSATVGGASVITDCAGPSAAMIIHNPDDRLAPFSGSESNRVLRMEENGCEWESMPTEPSAFNCTEHQACGDNPVLFCPHDIDIDGRGQYYPHNWPRSTAQYIADFIASLR